ncbi:hypothetical protein DID78_06945 [Candidatus Marinamargulisbacteria bacterium SCGC AG-343-D04]|nr:hypothetical protein DID78_06945 [Candidatus Marinamargulisbacteria bacterium SCGC AG-343-D04]
MSLSFPGIVNNRYSNENNTNYTSGENGSKNKIAENHKLHCAEAFTVPTGEASVETVTRKKEIGISISRDLRAVEPELFPPPAVPNKTNSAR